MIERPVFLVGSERSGTTLLRLMLDHNPSLAFHFEFEFAVDLLPPDGGFPDVADYRAYLASRRVFRHAGWSVDAALDYPHLVDSFLVQKRDRDRKELVGATVHRHFDRMRRIWPDARFVYLLRDGRDVARSVMQRGWTGNAWDACRWWIDAENTWQRVQAQVEESDRIEVRYEELVAHPAATLARVCAFIGVEYDEAMLAYPDASSYGSPDPGLVSQWRERMSAREVQLVEARIGERLAARGYPPSGQPAVRVTPWLERRLRLESRIGRARHRIGRYGWRLFACDLAARRLGLDSWAARLKREMDAVDERHLK